jgi:hypothetical protein
MTRAKDKVTREPDVSRQANPYHYPEGSPDLIDQILEADDLITRMGSRESD